MAPWTVRAPRTQNTEMGRATTNHHSGPAGSIEANLGHIHVFGLQAFRPLLNFQGYARALVERPISTCRNGGKMDKYIFATFALDKSKPFCGVKPLYCSGFFQDDSFCDLTLTYRLREAQPWESETRKPVLRNSKDVQGRLRSSV